jgi:hypothetical protein
VCSSDLDLAAELRDEGIDHPIIGKIQNLIKKRAEHMATELVHSA